MTKGISLSTWRKSWKKIMIPMEANKTYDMSDVKERD